MNSPRFDADALSRVEDAGLNASAPPQQLWLDGWLVRFCPGKAKRARCINAVAAGRLPVAEKLVLAAEVYRNASLPLVVRITPFSQPAGLDDMLDKLGLARFDNTAVMVADLQHASLDDALPPGTQLSPAGAADYARIVGTLRGSPESQQRAHAERVAHSPVPYQGWVLRRDDRVLACGQFAREGQLVGLYDVFTDPAARGHGLARQLCAQLLRQAQAEGARQAYLQVDVDNSAARAVYHRLGFVDGYGYHYRSADPAAA